MEPADAGSGLSPPPLTLRDHEQEPRLLWVSASQSVQLGQTTAVLPRSPDQPQPRGEQPSQVPHGTGQWLGRAREMRTAEAEKQPGEAARVHPGWAARRIADTDGRTSGSARPPRPWLPRVPTGRGRAAGRRGAMTDSGNPPGSTPPPAPWSPALLPSSHRPSQAPALTSFPGDPSRPGGPAAPGSPWRKEAEAKHRLSGRNSSTPAASSSVSLSIGGRGGPGGTPPESTPRVLAPGWVCSVPKAIVSPGPCAPL